MSRGGNQRLKTLLFGRVWPSLALRVLMLFRFRAFAFAGFGTKLRDGEGVVGCSSLHTGTRGQDGSD